MACVGGTVPGGGTDRQEAARCADEAIRDPNRTEANPKAEQWGSWPSRRGGYASTNLQKWFKRGRSIAQPWNNALNSQNAERTLAQRDRLLAGLSLPRDSNLCNAAARHSPSHRR